MSNLNQIPSGSTVEDFREIKTHGSGIEELAAAIVERLVPEDHQEPGLLDGPVPFTQRQVDLIRRCTRGQSEL